MVKHVTRFPVAAAVIAGALLVPAPIVVAAAPTALDVPASSIVGRAIEDGEVGAVKPIEARRPKPEAAAPRGNPLWSIPLSMLAATQERPISQPRAGRRRALWPVRSTSRSTHRRPP